MTVSPLRLGGGLVVCLGVLLAAAPLQTPPNPQTPQQPPVFRSGTAVVEVDVYPTRNGRTVEDLTIADLEVRENGDPQTIQDLQFVRVEPFTPDTVVTDPNNTREMLARVAESSNRVFVLYLDRYHVRVGGSIKARSALVELVQRMLAANDLFAVLTTGRPVSQLMFGRRTETIESQLAEYWWQLADRGSVRREEWEVKLAACYEYTGDGREVWARDGAVDRPLIDILKARRREDLVLTHLEELVLHLGRIRESRKAVMVITEGWVLYPGDRTVLQHEGLPPVGAVGGRISTQPDPRMGGVSSNECAAEFNRLFQLDNRQRFRDLMRLANQHNVTFYPINPSGLQVFDSSPNERSVVVDPTQALMQEMDRVRERRDAIETLAENTDGLAVVDNDLRAGLRRIADDVSAYYVLTYESSHTEQDGRYRRIEVRVKQPDVRVRARRGYFAPSARDAGARIVGAVEGPSPEVAEAFGTLSRLRVDSPLFTHATIADQHAAIVVELTPEQALRATTATPVTVTLAKADGTPVGTGEGQIAPATRGTVVRVPLGFDLVGPWRANVTVGAGRDRLQDSIVVTESTAGLVGDPIIYRAMPSPRAPLVPAADLRFRRTERVHVEWPRLDDLDRREARLLGRNGQPLPVPVTVTEREVDGRVTVAADVNLAPLTDGEYAIELRVGAGTVSETRVVAIRVTR